MVDLQSLVKAGLHFGHKKSRWCPKMAPYIWGYKNDIHLIDVSKTARQLEKAASFLKGVAAEGKTILWVGTKKAAQDAIAAVGEQLNMPCVNHRWIGGSLSNHSQVKKSVTKLLHYQDVLDRSEQFSYKKKELNTYQKLVDRLEKNIGGIKKMEWPVGAVVLIDARKERSALREASSTGVPVVALVDTNTDPSMVDYVIPGNDDIPRAINFVLDYLVAAVQEGLQEAKNKKAQEDALAAERAAARKEAAKKSVAAVKSDKKEAAPIKEQAKPAAAAKKVEPKKAEENSEDSSTN